MVGKNNEYVNQQKAGRKFEKYSIKKLKFGAVSVLIGVGFFLGHHVEASEVVSGTTVVTTNKETQENQKSKPESTETKVQLEVAFATNNETTIIQKNKVAEPVVEGTKEEPVTTELQKEITDLQTQVNRIRSNKKQQSQIEQAEKLIEEAKALQSAKTATQQEVDKKVKELSSFTSILKSIKAEETPKENKNQDSRNGKKMEEGTGFRAGEATTTPPTTTGVGADVVDATAIPAVEKTSFTDKEAAKAISKQIAWLDFGDVANWTNLGSGSRLKVGSTYTKEVMPGYHVTIKVKSLKPFQATEIYRKRMEAMGATDEEKATFDPNATNGLLHIDGLAEVSATDQGDYSEIKKAGIIDAGTRKISIGSTKDGANIGVQFEISGTYKGRTVRPSVVMLDSESNDFGENIIFTTNGRGWEKVLEINKNVSNPKGYVPINNFESPKNLAAIGRYQPGVLGPRTSETAVNIVKVGSGKIAAKYLTNPDRVTGGLGTGVFGPVATAAEFSIPVVMTRDASEVGLYILTGGQQRSMMGIAPIDEGDAPESYGETFHMISTKNGLTGAEVNQPYLGSERPDMDTNNTKDWLGDDKSPEANNDPHADEGIKQILPDNLKNVDRQIIKLDRTNGHYTYSLDIQAHTGGAPQAHIYGWIDFNNNGKFDENERSELATITNDSTVTLHFNRSFTEVDPKLGELGTRVRIAINEKEIEKPTGVAFSGEVEDFKTQITHPPRGEQVRTEDRPRITQSGHITFTARGKVAYNVTEDAEIRTDIPPVYIDNKTGHPITLPADGIYTVAGQGTYKITLAANNKDVDVQFTPEDGFVGEAHGITIRRQDTNDATTGWINRNTNTSMDGLYIPKVVVTGKSENASSSNLQGLSQSGTPVFRGEWNNNPATPTATNPAKLVDPRTNEVTGATTVDAFDSNNNKIGTYTIEPTSGKVTFTPKKDFTGTPIPAIVSLDLVDGHDKDGQPATTLIRATYSPTVIPIIPQEEASTTSGVQGKPQTSPISLNTPDIETNTVNFNKGSQEGPNGESVELDATTLTLLDGDGHEVTSVTIPQQGKYELNKANKTITFTPNKDFVGPATPVKVQIKDVNGTKVETTYTPTVTDVTMESKDKTSEAPQGKTQTGTPEFKVSDPNVQISGYKLVDPVTKTPVDSTEIEVPNEGTYKIDKTTGQVTFIPKPEFKGPATGITVQATDENGETKDATYKPTVTPIEVTPGDKTTKDIQGVPQSEIPTFTIPDGVTNASITSRKLVDPTNNQPTDSVTLEGKGTFTINGNGKVTFTPVPSYTGDVPAIKVEATITVTNEKNESTTITSTANYKPVIVPVEIEKTPVESTNLQGLEQTGRPTFTSPTVTVNGEQKTVSIKPNSYKLVKDGVEVPTTPAYKQGTTEEIGTYTINASTGEVTFTPIDKTYTGAVEPAVVQATGSNGSKVNTTYTPSITPVSPTAEKSVTSGVQGKPQTSSIVLDTKETGDDKGTTVNFNKGTEEGPNGERVNLDSATLTLLDSSNAPVDSVTTPQGKYELNKANKTITFTPNKDFVGPATPVKVQIKDVNGTKVETTYTPTVEEVTPTGKDSATTGPQGVAQTSPIVFNQKDEADNTTVNFETGHERVELKQDTLTLVNENGEKVTTITVPEVGTYELKDGAITFTPVKTFKGTAEGVTVQVEDENGKVVTKKYVPTVIPVTPEGENAETEGPKAQPQTSTIVFDKKDEDTTTVNFNKGHESVALDPTTTTLVGKDGSPATEVKVPGEGTYTLINNVITFTPESEFVGKTTGVSVQVKDVNGTVVTKTYTPTVRPVTTFVDETGTPITADKSNNPVIHEEDGTKPKKDIYGYKFIRVELDNKGNTKHIYEPAKGESVKVSYVSTTGEVLKDSQTVQPKDTLVGTAYDASTETIKSERIEKDGKVYLLKERKAGSASEKGKVSDKEQTITYVYEEAKESEPKRNYGSVVVLYTDQFGRPISGITDTGKEVGNTVLDTSNAPLNTKYDTTDNKPQTITTKDGKVYTLKKVTKNSDAEQSGVKGRTSVVTYVYEMLNNTEELPEAHVGIVLVNYQDEDGNLISGKTPEGKDVPNVVVDTDATLVGEKYDTTDNKPIVIIAENGDVYELVKTSDTSVEKGEVVEGATIVDYVYRKVETKFVDENGKEIKSSEKGTKSKEEISEYVFKETKKDEKGNTIHVYRQVVTSYVDENGKEIKSSEKGTKSKEEISGYVFKETKKDEKGNTIHVYTKKSSSTVLIPNTENGQTTIWKDVDGNIIKTQENGKKEHSVINGYVYDHSEEDKDGNTTHIYRKVNSTTSEVNEKQTSYVDENGKAVQTTKQGQHPQDKIAGYEFVRTETDANGNVRHVYRQVSQSPATVEQRKNELPNTGTGEEVTIFGAAAASILAGLGIVMPGKKKEEE